MNQDQTWTDESHVEDMEEMFSAITEVYAKYWNDFFHFALFEEDDESWDRAFERTHRHYLEKLRIPSRGQAIDLACGRGGFAEYLARHSDADILGIDISHAQLAQAERRSRPNLRFRHHDVMRVDALGERFDAASFMDADCYLPDKGAALAAIARVLRPGARFLMIAWCKRDGLDQIQEELVLEPFMRFWGVPGLETPAGYRHHFRAAGLDLIEEADLNDRTRRNWDFGYEQAIEAVRDLSFAKAAAFLWQGHAPNEAGIQLAKDQFHAALYIKAAFDAGLLRYTYFLAEKRS